MQAEFVPETLRQAIQAAQDKKAADLVLLDLHPAASFTDYFLLCTGASSRQIQAIATAIEEQLSRMGLQPLHIEGAEFAEWMLLDYLDFVVHIFSERARAFYDLERLWRSARRLPVPEQIPTTKPETRTRSST